MGARVRCAARRRGSEPARGLSALHKDVVRRRPPSVATGRNEKEGGEVDGEEAKRKRDPSRVEIQVASQRQVCRAKPNPGLLPPSSKMTCFFIA